MYITDEWVRRVTGKHRTTITRWRQKNTWPPELRLLAQLQIDGDVGAIHAKWAGWRLDPKTGELVGPAGEAFMPAELLAMPLRYQQLRELEQRLAALAPESRSLIARLANRLRRRANPITSVDPR